MSSPLLQEWIKSPDQHVAEEVIPVNQVQKQSRLIVFTIDVLSEFENKHKRTAGCLYAITIAFCFALLAYSRLEENDQALPILEIFFVSQLIMFAINFYLITKSKILPFIQDDILNTTVKKTGISFLLALVLFVGSLQYPHNNMSIFCFLCSCLFSGIFEKYYHNQNFDQKEIIMGLGSLVGLALTLGIPQLIMTELLLDYARGMFFATTAGLCLVYAGETMRQLENQNIFTITHVIGLLNVVFLPLFFPMEGLLSPNLLDWLYFFVVAISFLLVVPVIIRMFAIERQSLILHYLSWCVPFFLGFKFIFSGYVPDLLKLIGCSIVFFTSLVLFSFQKVKIHSGSFYKDRERAEPNRPKNPCELPLWTNKISE